MKTVEGLNTILGVAVKEFRIKKGITQEKLAEKCETSAVYISEIERGVKQPTLNTVLVICSALEINPHELISRIEEQQNNT